MYQLHSLFAIVFIKIPLQPTHIKTCTQIFTAALFVTAKNWK